MKALFSVSVCVLVSELLSGFYITMSFVSVSSGCCTFYFDLSFKYFHCNSYLS